MEEQVSKSQEIDVNNKGLLVASSQSIKLDDKYSNGFTANMETWQDADSSLPDGEVKVTITIAGESQGFHIFNIQTTYVKIRKLLRDATQPPAAVH